MSSNNRRNIDPKILNWSVALPIGTLAIVGLVFFLSSTYEPNWFFNWEGVRPEIRDTVKLIEEYGSITSGAVGHSGRTPQQWHRRRWLISNTNENELLRLIKHPNGVVKATAYEALIKRKSTTNKFDLISRALNDTTTFIYFQSGCIGEMLMLGEYIVEHVTYLSDKAPPPLPQSGLLEKHELTQTEIKELTNLYEERKEKKWEYVERNFKEK